MRSKGIEVGEHGELHAGPPMAWVASLGLCTLGDAMLGRWVLLPLLVAGFYGGTFNIALVTYPLLPFWRGWTRRRGLIAWYLIEVGGLWGATMIVLILLSQWWPRWSWSGTSSLRVLGWVFFVGSVVAGTWAVAKMGMGKTAARRSTVPPGGRGRGEWCYATAGGRGPVSVRA